MPAFGLWDFFKYKVKKLIGQEECGCVFTDWFFIKKCKKMITISAEQRLGTLRIDPRIDFMSQSIGCPQPVLFRVLGLLKPSVVNHIISLGVYSFRNSYTIKYNFSILIKIQTIIRSYSSTSYFDIAGFCKRIIPILTYHKGTRIIALAAAMLTRKSELKMFPRGISQ